MHPLVWLTIMAAPPAAAEPDPAKVSQQLLDELAEINGVPGMGAAIWQGDRIIWTGSTGFRDLDRRLPVDERTIFRLASVSKLIAATAAAKLGEQGKLDLDAPVESILPWLDNDWPPINARQLAAHISGLPHYQSEDAGRGSLHYPTSRAAVGIFEKRSLLRRPGEGYSYSSWGYTLLGALIEERSGQPFTDYVTNGVTPGLKVVPDATDSDDPNASLAYEFIDRVPRRAARHDFSYTWGGGGMGATPSAIATFGGNMLRNRIVTGEKFEQMLEPAVLSDGSKAGAEDYAVGFGWRTSLDEAGARIAHHNGVTVGARSTLVLWRDEDMAVSLLSNALWTASIDRTARMIAAPHRPLPRGLVASACPTKAKRYTGSFGGQPVSGTVAFSVKGRVCVGTLEPTGELRSWLSGGPQPDSAKIKLVGLDGVGGLARAGFVTLYGIYDWRAQADGSFKVALSATRDLLIRVD